jgi:hypothetical protein
MSLIRSLADLNRAACRSLGRKFPRFVAYPSYRDELMRRIRADLEKRPGDVLEVGGIDRPLLTKGPGYLYDGMDIDEKEACYEIYDHFFIQSIEEPADRQYAMVISMTLLEHVPDNPASIRNIYAALVPGGTTHHYVPSSNHPYSLLLRLVGPRWQTILIRHLRPRSVGKTGYPTYFDHCTVAKMTALFRETGFEDIDAVPYYRAHDYFAFFLPAYVAVVCFENLCKRFGWSTFASGFVISARKPRS